MPLTAEQQSALLKAYQRGIASGMTKEQATASVKDYLVKSGQYDSAKAAYQSPETTADQPAQPKLSPDLVAIKTQAPEQELERSGAPAPSPAPSTVTAPAPSPKPTPTSTPNATAAVTGAIVTPQRAQQINANLVEGAKNAKQNFADVNTFRAAYGYDQKPEGERAILDSFWSKYAEQNAKTPAPAAPAPVQTRNAMVSAIWNNQETPEMKASKDYAGLKAAADRARKFSAMSADELVGAITNSQLTDAQAAVISRLDPSFAAKWEAAKAQYKLKVDTGIANSTAASIANAALGSTDGTVGESYDDPIISAIKKQIEALNSATAITQAEKDAKAEVNSKKAKIDELTQSRDKIYDDIVASHPGLPKSLTMAMAAEKAKPLNEQIATLTREANLALGIYNAAVEQRQTSGETAKTVASLNLEVAKRFAEVQEARAKALKESVKNLDTKVETINVNGMPTKVLINMQTGKTIADLGPDVSSTKYQLTDYMGMKFAFDPITGKSKPVNMGNLGGNPEQEQKLNKEYSSETLVKGFIKTKTAFEQVKSILESGAPNGIKDITLMYNFVKGLDPESVVRESEVGLLSQANSILGRLTLAVDKAKDGRVLTSEVAKQIGEQMQDFYSIAKSELTKKQAAYIRRAADVNARIDRVIDGDIYIPTDPGSDDYLSDGVSDEELSNYLK